MTEHETDNTNDTGRGDETEPKPTPSNPDEDALAQAEERIAALERELDEAKGLRLRALADFQNYQRRSLQNEDEAKRQGAAGVLRTMIGALDHFDQALAQPTEKLTVEQAVAGLRLIREEIVRALETAHGVTVIRPEANAEFTPGRHEAIAQLPKEGVEPGRIVEVYQPGYALGDRVLRAAKVIVAPGEPDADAAEETEE